MHSYIRPGVDVVLRSPTGLLKIVKIIPDTTINIPKIGTFSANAILGRPYYFTYELHEPANGEKESTLRVVSAEELNLEIITNKAATPAESRDELVAADSELIGQNGERNNRLTVDDPSRQALTMEEIEELKKTNLGSGKEIISQILASHSGLKEKTAFALAKYTLRKSRKYMKRFTILPLDVSMLVEYQLEKEAPKIMELREEVLGLVMSWANVHFSPDVETGGDAVPDIGRGRWLVVDDTGGLVVAAMAERMDLLYKDDEYDNEEDLDEESHNGDQLSLEEAEAQAEPTDLEENPLDSATANPAVGNNSKPAKRKAEPPPLSNTNTITVVHANPQPNLSFLQHFAYSSENPSSTSNHPLYTHLRSVTWLQLLDPNADALYQEPPFLSESSLAGMKSGKRGNYYRKRNRWEKVKKVVDDTRAGCFDGLVVASTMEPIQIMKHCVPLVRGGGSVVVYSPAVEPLTHLLDLYSRDRKGAYVRAVQAAASEGKAPELDEEIDFPLNPTLVLNPMLQTARAREWQVLPGRTHPLMTSRGGSEGYLFTATRVLPMDGVKVEARGRFSKKRKMAQALATPETDAGAEVSKMTKGTDVLGSLADGVAGAGVGVEEELELDATNTQ